MEQAGVEAPEFEELWDIDKPAMLWRCSGWLVIEGHSPLDLDDTSFLLAVGPSARWQEIKEILNSDDDDERPKSRFIRELL